MVGPFMQGMVLLGIIYWYTKGMMSLINDYYRGEFQRKLKTEKLQNDSVVADVGFTDVDAIVAHSLLQMQGLVQEATTTTAAAAATTTPSTASSGADKGVNVCHKGSGLMQLMRLLQGQRACSWQDAGQHCCWIDGYSVANQA